MHAEISVRKFGHVNNILREKARILGVNEGKQIVKCKYHMKNAKFESALYCLPLFCPGLLCLYHASRTYGVTKASQSWARDTFLRTTSKYCVEKWNLLWSRSCFLRIFVSTTAIIYSKLLSLTLRKFVMLMWWLDDAIWNMRSFLKALGKLLLDFRFLMNTVSKILLSVATFWCFGLRFLYKK